MKSGAIHIIRKILTWLTITIIALFILFEALLFGIEIYIDQVHLKPLAMEMKQKLAQLPPEKKRFPQSLIEAKIYLTEPCFEKEKWFYEKSAVFSIQLTLIKLIIFNSTSDNVFIRRINNYSSSLLMHNINNKPRKPLFDYIFFIAPFKIDKYLSKEEILQINFIYGYYGSNIYGVHEAAQFYFGKPLHELQEDDLIGLARMAERPSDYNPKKHPEKYKQAIESGKKLIEEARKQTCD